jgi:hypothetical protein
MMQSLTHHSEGCWIAFLLLVILAFVANRLDLISWLARLGHRERDRHEEKRNNEDTDEYWRIHR